VKTRAPNERQPTPQATFNDPDETESPQAASEWLSRRPCTDRASEFQERLKMVPRVFVLLAFRDILRRRAMLVAFGVEADINS
jgi:hypothetical protein